MRYSTKVVLQMTDVIGEYIVIEKNKHDYEGPVALCCGPSGQQTSEAGQAQSFSQLLNSAFQQRFAQQGQILNQLNTTLSPIISQGPSQQGFSAQELAALNTQAINSAAAANRAAQQATANFGAGRASDSGLTSGVQRQLQAATASGAAQALAGRQAQITEANWDTGRQNFVNALNAQLAASGQYAPTSYAGAATGAEQTAFSEATQIQNMKNAEQAAIAGGITSLAAPFMAGATAGLAGTGGESFGQKLSDFVSGGLQNLG